jgi:hypothetical protein
MRKETIVQQEQNNLRGRDLSQQPDDGRDRGLAGDDVTTMSGVTGMNNTAGQNDTTTDAGVVAIDAILPDMIVVGADGDEVGVVREASGRLIRVDRMAAGEVLIPLSAVQDNDGSSLRLAIASSDVDRMGWQSPA